MPLDGEWNCLQGLSSAERARLKGEIQRAVEAGATGNIMVEAA